MTDPFKPATVKVVRTYTVTYELDRQAYYGRWTDEEILAAEAEDYDTGRQCQADLTEVTVTFNSGDEA